MAIDESLRTAIDLAVQTALDEDRAFDDATSLAVVDPALAGRARFLAKASGVAAGFPVAADVFACFEPGARFTQLVNEGASFRSGDILAEVEAPVRALLQGERTALNFVQRLCATATMARAFTDAVAGTAAVILDTRKTTPGMRDLEKYAVRCGGGTNHRRDLASMAMLKDNHLEALSRAGLSLAEGVARIRERTPGVPVEIEIDRLDQLDEALAAKPEWILLDNMAPDVMRESVERTAGRAKLEASGGVSLEAVRAIAESGVDAVSVGALTHSAGSLDISLELWFDSEAAGA